MGLFIFINEMCELNFLLKLSAELSNFERNQNTYYYENTG